MKTEIVKVSGQQPDLQALEYCGAVIREGGLVAFPTETVYGLGANAFDDGAVRSIFTAKNRPCDNPLIVHIDDYGMLKGVADFNNEREREYFTRLGEAYWPGPLTMIVGKDEKIPPAVSCGLQTVGIRMPVHPVARALIQVSGVPIAAPSANSSGRPSPTRFSHVYEDMYGRVDVIIDGGDCCVGVESTVLDLVSPEPTILRPGAITAEDVERVLGACQEYDWKGLEGKVEKPRSPGMKYRHYAPKATVTVYEGSREQVTERICFEIDRARAEGLLVGVLATDETKEVYKSAQVVLSLGKTEDSASHAGRLFDCLREFDGQGAQIVFAEAVVQTGVGDAVMNRLFRAAGGRIVSCEDGLKGKGEQR